MVGRADVIFGAAIPPPVMDIGGADMVTWVELEVSVRAGRVAAAVVADEPFVVDGGDCVVVCCGSAMAKENSEMRRAAAKMLIDRAVGCALWAGMLPISIDYQHFRTVLCDEGSSRSKILNKEDVGRLEVES